MGNLRIPFEPEQYYHLYNHGNSKDNLFIDEENYFFFLRRYERYLSLVAETYAYCLMPNHFHFLLKTKPAATIQANLIMLEEPLHRIKRWSDKLEADYPKFISFCLSNFFNSYSKAFNKKYQRKGSLFLPNVQRKLVDSILYRLQLVCYIHCNPIHHGFTNDIMDWPYSSYQPIIIGTNRELLSNESLEWFGGKKDFIKEHERYLHALILHPRGL